MLSGKQKVRRDTPQRTLQNLLPQGLYKEQREYSRVTFIMSTRDCGRMGLMPSPISSTDNICARAHFKGMKNPCCQVFNAPGDEPTLPPARALPR